MPTDFFTLESLATLAGATAGTVLIANTAQMAFKFNPKWFALVVAEVITVGVAMSTGFSVQKLLVAIVNGCIIYGAAAGTTSIGNSLRKAQPKAVVVTPTDDRALRARTPVREQSVARRGFWDDWWPAATA